MEAELARMAFSMGVVVGFEPLGAGDLACSIELVEPVTRQTLYPPKALLVDEISGERIDLGYPPAASAL